MSDSDSNEDETDAQTQTSLKVKMGVPMVMLSWQMIRRMILVSYILNCIGLLYAFALIIAAVKTQVNIGDFLNMVTDGDGTALPACLGISGSLCLLLNIVIIVATCKACKKSRNRVVNSILFTLVLSGNCIVVLLLILGIVAVSHAYTFHHRLHDGISDAMLNYAINPQLKMRMDILQINFQCCGSRSYNEWFDIPWYDTSLACSEKHQITRDDAPFSCCSMKSHFPCIHHDLMSIGTSYLYAPESNLSISERGCHTILLKYTRVVAWKTAAGLFGLALIEAAICIITRFIQTGHTEFYRFEKESHWHTTWLIGCYKGKKPKLAPKPPPVPEALKE